MEQKKSVGVSKHVDVKVALSLVAVISFAWFLLEIYPVDHTSPVPFQLLEGSIGAIVLIISLFFAVIFLALLLWRGALILICFGGFVLLFRLANAFIFYDGEPLL